jgi:hypothetical protein
MSKFTQKKDGNGQPVFTKGGQPVMDVTIRTLNPNPRISKGEEPKTYWVGSVTQEGVVTENGTPKLAPFIMYEGAFSRDPASFDFFKVGAKISCAINLLPPREGEEKGSILLSGLGVNLPIEAVTADDFDFQLDAKDAYANAEKLVAENEKVGDDKF